MELAQVMHYVRMPSALTVLGIMYGLYGALHIVYSLRVGYWSGSITGLGSFVRYHYWWVLSVVLGTIMLVLFVDLPVTLLCQKLYNVDVYTAFDFINSMAEGWFVGGICFTLFLFFEFFAQHGKSTTRWSATLESATGKLWHQRAVVSKIGLMASLYAGLLNTLAKGVFNRERPSISLDSGHFFHFFTSGMQQIGDLFYASNSLPSGHTITIFAAITPWLLYTRNIGLKLVLLICGILVAIARVYTINHWLSDVCLSAVLGIIIGRVIYNINRQRLEY